MKSKIAKWGNSAAVRLPKAALEATGLKPGARVDVMVQGRDLVLREVGKIPRYTLEQLLAEMDRLGPENRPEVVDWGPDVGAEIIDDDYSRGIVASPSRRSRLGRSSADAGKRAKRRKTSRGAHRT